MSSKSFSLQPFNSQANVNISGHISRESDDLAIKYTLVGNLTELVIPEPTNKPTRRNELWENTCFEFFLGVKDTPQYWEFNLSPSSNWNVYRFNNYRQGMEEETAFTSLPFLIEQNETYLNLSLKLGLSLIVNTNEIIEIAIATVTKFKNNQITYWALTHPQKEADFHHRDSFKILL